MGWVKMDDYYYQNGDFTICRAHSVLLPFSLYQGEKLIKCFTKFNEAIAAYDAIQSTGDQPS